MKRSFLLYLSLCLGIGTLMAEGVGTKHVVDCGTWMELTATAAEDYHFVSWNDGNKDSIRQIQVNEDAHYIAYFAANCADYANWPVVALYDWLMMLNVRAINEMGYYFGPENVKWYRVQGEPDDLMSDSRDDMVVGGGYYLTLAKNFSGTGDYYAVVDISTTTSGMLCDGIMRTMIIHYCSDESHPRKMALMPNVSTRSGQMKLVGLVPSEQSELYVYSATGQLLETHTVSDNTYYMLQAPVTDGCFYVKVITPSFQTTLPFLVR